jgi:hypothetical protein
MRFLEKCKDGGHQSPVDGYVLIELKGWFSIILLRFNPGAREKSHTHAFNAISWFLSGSTTEYIQGQSPKHRTGLCLPHITTRNVNHRYNCYKPAWCLTFRGPWVSWWKDGTKYLSWGRKVVAEIFS